MFNKIKKGIISKQGNDIVQTLIVLIIIGALVITICMVISNKFSKSSNKTMNTISNGTIDTIRNALSPELEDISGL